VLLVDPASSPGTPDDDVDVVPLLVPPPLVE
jgi:hypothetical protein